MNDDGKSDTPIVPRKDANKRCGSPHPAERLEERGVTKGNSGQQRTFWTQSQADVTQALDRIRHAMNPWRGVTTQGRSPVR